MTDAREIYQHHAAQYAELVGYEDAAGNLSRTLKELLPSKGASVVELGAGTGRVTALLAPHVSPVRAFDGALPMVEEARRRFAEQGIRNCRFDCADNAALPVPSASAELALAGWSFGHQTTWAPHAWREPVERALAEMFRVLRPGGTAVVIETLGTGHTEPFTPPALLGQYFELLEGDWHFERTWIRTDYHFPSLARGAELLEFFFGPAKADAFREKGQATFPECTGIWVRTQLEETQA